jgi:hypothetical protein
MGIAYSNPIGTEGKTGISIRGVCYIDILLALADILPVRFPISPVLDNTNYVTQHHGHVANT